MPSTEHTRRATLIAALVAAVGTAAARPPTLEADGPAAIVNPVPGRLNLRVGDVETAAIPSLLADAAPDFRGAFRHVVLLDGPITPARRAALTAAGARLADYLPTDAFIADLAAANPAALRALPFVRWVGAYQDAWKLDPAIGSLQPATPERLALAGRAEVAVAITLFSGVTLDDGLAALRAVPALAVLDSEQLGDAHTVFATIPAAALRVLAPIAPVQFVEELGEFTPRNATVRWIVQSNVSNVTPFYDRGITGAGQTLGHMDTQLALNHCSFRDAEGDPPGPNHRKVVAYNTTQGFEFHGTHTAGTAVGDAGATDDSRGVAYNARVAHNRIPSYTDASIYNALTTHHNQGARVHTNSWGNDGTTSYDGMCRGIDRFSWDNQDSLVAFAVTNQSTLKNPENAKNCLAVGASGDSGSQQNHCSGGTGPTSDGRRKPEVYTPGCNIRSASSSSGCSLSTATGTSMACPSTAGTGLLIRQYFADGFYPTGAPNASDGFTATGALVKAVLINASVDMTGVAGYPSNREGWGRVLADSSAFFAGDSRRLVVHDLRNNTPDALSTGGSVAFPITVESAGEPLRVTLAFHDYPATAGASYAPVNDLDLTVTAPDGTTYLGNVFASGFSTTGGAADPRNNVEQVHLAAPAAGAWTVTVSARAVSQGQQGFALVVTGAVTEPSGGCPADFNGDGTVDSDDFFDFLNAYNLQDPAADFNGDGSVDSDDFFDFLNAYNAGC